MTESKAFDTYFVLNGLINGEEGVMAIPAVGGNDLPQADGWYFIVDGMDDGAGPFTRKISAIKNGESYVALLEERSMKHRRVVSALESCVAVENRLRLRLLCACLGASLILLIMVVIGAL